jgi:hypothetical protein
VPLRRSSTLLVALLGVAVLLLGGCREEDPRQGSDPDPEQVDAVETPELGACRRLTPRDVAAASNATSTVDCAEPHTAQTYAVGQLPAALDDAPYDDPTVGQFAYDICSERYLRYLGADESLAMRTVLSWAWFRPSPQAWEDGARWYRCELVGGGDQSKAYVELPEDARGLLLEASDRWLVCAQGPSVSGSVKIPCSQPHDWRAVSTIKLGEESTRYPGDRVVQVRTRDFCSTSVGAILGYPVDYDFGYTWFHAAEWEAGNRRAICWARTSR